MFYSDLHIIFLIDFVSCIYSINYILYVTRSTNGTVHYNRIFICNHQRKRFPTFPLNQFPTGPASSKRGNLARARARGAGLSRTSQTQLLARFRALPDPDDEVHGVGRGGEDKDGDRRRIPTGRPGPAGCGCKNAHETTLPFVGRVVGHVWLYGERARGGP